MMLSGLCQSIYLFDIVFVKIYAFSLTTVSWLLMNVKFIEIVDSGVAFDFCDFNTLL